MEIAGQYRLRADRDSVWNALHDPQVLQACIPGCEAVEAVTEEEVRATVAATIGPVKSRFRTTIRLTDRVPPERYTMHGDGQGGTAGFGRGQAHVTLEAEDASTLLHYRAQFTVGGKLAQVGSRLVAGATRRMADQFFASFAECIGAVPAEPVDDAPGRSGDGDGDRGGDGDGDAGARVPTPGEAALGRGKAAADALPPIPRAAAQAAGGETGASGRRPTKPRRLPAVMWWGLGGLLALVILLLFAR